MISRAASPIACAPVEQAVTTEWFGPLKPVADRDLAGGEVDQRPGMKNGLMRRGPAFAAG